MLEELDEYRRRYDSLAFSEHQAMYRRIAEVYPEQAFWNAAECLAFLKHYKPRIVHEIGGHDGALAAEMLAQCKFIDRWHNLELVLGNSVCTDRRYHQHVKRDWAWASPLYFDALVLSHVVEHVSPHHFFRMLGALKGKAVYVDAPLRESDRTEWMGTETAHVLPYSMQEVDQAFAEFGWRVTHSGVSDLHGFVSRTRWYERA